MHPLYLPLLHVCAGILFIQALCYFSTCRCQRTVKHYRILWDGKQFTFGLGHFADIQSLKEHFDNQPVISGESGQILFTALMTLFQMHPNVCIPYWCVIKRISRISTYSLLGAGYNEWFFIPRC